MAYGIIEFIPDIGKEHTGPAGSAEIIDGKFDTRQGGSGVNPGPHVARITAMEERPKPGTDDETQIPDNKPPIFSEFPMEMNLTGKSVTFEVPDTAKGYSPLQAGKKSRGSP